MTAPLTLALVGLISVAGSFVQASTGFGYAVTVMALWPLFLPYKTALVVELLDLNILALRLLSNLVQFIL